MAENRLLNIPERNERMRNYHAANRLLRFSPQESDFYGRHLRNLWGPGGVDNPDGSRSTLYQTTIDADGRSYTIPTVWDGQILPVEEAIKRVQSVGWDQFPSYSSPEEAESRYQQMHGFIDRDMGAYWQSRKP